MLTRLSLSSAAALVVAGVLLSASAQTPQVTVTLVRWPFT
jgi:hypothetical protein